jgi:uncharacterized membrane protein
MNKISALVFSFLLLGVSQIALAQNAVNDNENASVLHQNGQIYLVVLVLLTIFAGIIFYLIRLEKKLNKLEKKEG